MVNINTGLSICIISKNEENNIERCIKSVQGISNDIILVDTGSTDKTMEIAKNLNVKVVEHPWTNDFSAARNVSIDHAKEPWILFLDCDEEMTKENGEAVISLINSANNFEGYYLRLVNIIDNLQVSDAIVLRLFKNKPEYRFKGKMHEQIINSIQNLKGPESIGSTPIQILHYGYDPKVSDTDKKSKRNLDILLSYEEKDKDGYYYYVLGNEYARMDDYDTAMDIYLKSLKVTNAKSFRYIYYPYLAMNIVKVLHSKKSYKEEIKYLEEFHETLSDFKDLYFLECLLYIELGNLTHAKASLNKYLTCPKGQYEYPSNNFENYYNISKLLYDLDAGIVDHEEDTLTVWIYSDHYDDKLRDCLKSINEIAYEVIVITSNYDNFDTSGITNYCGKILKISEYNKDKAFKMAMKISRGRYIFNLKPNNLCSQSAQMQLMYLLKDDDYDGYLINELDMVTEKTTQEFRIFKNTKRFNTFEEYEESLRKSKLGIVDSKIIIHRDTRNN